MQKTILILAVVGALALAGCASTNSNANTSTPTASTTTSTPSSTSGVPELDFTATQSGPPSNGTTYAYTGPDTATAGWNLVKITNHGMEPHQVVFMKLKQGETLDQHMAAMMAAMQPPSNSSGGMMDNSSGSTGSMGEPDPYYGGVAVSSPPAPPGSGAPAYSTSSESYVWLDPGSYVIECEIPGAAGPHMLHGMMKQINVTGTAPAMSTNEPTPDLTLTLKDFNFSWDKTPTAGHHVVKVVNGGSMPHEAVLLHMAPGKTVDDFLSWSEAPNGPPPAADSFGAGAIEKGKTEYFVGDFAPGQAYGEVCFMPTPDGKLHFMLGMKDTLHVA